MEITGARDFVGDPASLPQRDPRPVQRQHLGALRPGPRRLGPGDPPPHGHDERAPGRAAPVAAAHPGVLRGRGPRPDPAGPPGALGEGLGPGRAGAPLPPAQHVVLRHDAQEPLLHLPQRVRGGEPPHGGGALPRVRARAHQGGLRRALQRRARLGQVRRDRAGQGHPQLEEDSLRDKAAGLPQAAAPGHQDAPPLRGQHAAAEVRRFRHDSAFHMAQAAQRPPPSPRRCTLNSARPEFPRFVIHSMIKVFLN